MAGAASQTGGAGKTIGVAVIHGVGETDTGWRNAYVVDRLSNTNGPVQPAAFSELHDRRLTETAGTEIQLRPEEWTSGQYLAHRSGGRPW